MSDLVIRNARLVDGTGAPARMADVTVDGGIIVGVDMAGTAALAGAHRRIDADGLLLTPGWVDVHTHYDAQVSWDPWMTPSSWHGVTTVVMGNCGVGFAPTAPDRHEWLIELMEGVEDIPGSAMTEGITWDWSTFPEYLAAVAAQPHVLDIGAQIAHGPLRAFVMGERGATNETATDDDIARMALLVEEALGAGALGFSTSRTPLHRSKGGELVPGTTAGADELLGIGAAIRRAGHGVFQFAPEHANLPVTEWPWMRELAALTGQPVSVNLNQPDSAPEVWRRVLQLLDEAAADGLPIYAQVAGRSIGILYCLHGSVHPLLFHPAYAEVAHLPMPARLAALADPARRRRIIEDVPDDGGFFRAVVLDKLDRVYPVDRDDIDYEPDASASVLARARASGTPPMALLLDTLTAADGNGMIYAPFFNYAYGDLSMTYEVTRHERTRMGLSDAGAHCGAICDGGTPTFMVTHWTRDRTRGPRLPLEHVVHRQTQQTAALYGLHDRGAVIPGQRADLALIDYDALSFDAPRMVFDLPAEGRRLVQHARGYRAVFVSGEQTVADDELTGALPGRLIRGPQRC
ncbi:MAG: putative hydrolase [Ilumatobacteraceae bacterium]|nr:putative hydrolase [Ilumatobacteraceae bacterium]